MDKRIEELLRKIKNAHEIYVRTDERRKRRIFDACEWVFKELVSLTKVDRSFFEALLIGGIDFLLAEYGDEEERIVGAFKTDQTAEDLQDVKSMDLIGALAWQKQGTTITPLLFKKGRTMQQVRLQAQFMKNQILCYSRLDR